MVPSFNSSSEEVFEITVKEKQSKRRHPSSGNLIRELCLLGRRSNHDHGHEKRKSSTLDKLEKKKYLKKKSQTNLMKGVLLLPGLMATDIMFAICQNQFYREKTLPHLFQILFSTRSSF